MAMVQRWLLFGWIGKTASIVVALYGVAWVLGNLGMDRAAHQLAVAAIFVLSCLFAAMFIRLVWRDATSHHRR
jgi:predicted MFS family arabinose efflux permease